MHFLHGRAKLCALYHLIQAQPINTPNCFIFKDNVSYCRSGYNVSGMGSLLGTSPLGWLPKKKKTIHPFQLVIKFGQCQMVGPKA